MNMSSLRRNGLLCLCLMLSACASQDGPSINDYAAAAYQPARPLPMQGWNATWKLGQEAFQVALLQPGQGERLPLVIYLPGLGESAQSSALWQQSWAQAGYAVLGLQLERFGPALYNSPDAEAGAFRELARKAYAPDALAQRIDLVGQVLQQVRQLAERGDERFTRLDLDQVVVAGFDLGAQTAAAIAGEQDNGQARQLGWKPKAAILISPYARAYTSAERYQGIDVPLLSITGPLDEDPFSWVESASLRQTLFSHLPADNPSYQLLLEDISHAALSGNPAPRVQSTPSPRKGSAAAAPNSQAYADLWQVTTVSAVSRAFLDSQVRHSAQAGRWLDGEAAHWLQPLGNLQRK